MQLLMYAEKRARKALVRFHSEGISPDEQLRIFGTLADLGLQDPFVEVGFAGHLGNSAYVSVDEAVDMGLTPGHLQAAITEPREFVLKTNTNPSNKET